MTEVPPMLLRSRVWTGFGMSAAIISGLIATLGLATGANAGGLFVALLITGLGSAFGALYVLEGGRSPKLIQQAAVELAVGRLRHWTRGSRSQPASAPPAEEGAATASPPEHRAETMAATTVEPGDDNTIDAILDLLEGQARKTVVTAAEAVGKLRGGASELEIQAYDIRSGCDDTEVAVQAASQGIQRVASATEQLDGSISAIAERCAVAVQTTGAAVERAQSTRREVATLAEAARDIDEIVKLISGIAGRTNMLALNATIEAARAGEAGRGFAIVASEVKTLARQTADATQRISERIRSIQQASGTAVWAMADIDRLAVELQGLIGEVNATVVAQVDTVRAIGDNARTVAHDAKRATDCVTSIVTTISDTGTLAEQLSGFSENVHDFIRNLQHDLLRLVRGSGPRDRRRYTRIPTAIEAVIEREGGEPVASMIVDVSLGGATLVEPVDAPDQSAVSLRIGDLVLPGTLLRREPPQRFGIRFDELEDFTLQRLVGFLDKSDSSDRQAAA